MSDLKSLASQLAVYEMTGEELRAMVEAHAASIVACREKVNAALGALVPASEDDVPKELRRSEVFLQTLDQLAQFQDEAEFCASHIPKDKAFMFDATKLLAFRSRWAPLDLDVDKLAFAPRPAVAPSAQAERMQSSLLTATPRISFPDGVMIHRVPGR